MKLSLKLAAGLMVVMTLVLTAYGVMRVRREAALFELDMKRDHRHVGRTLSLVVGELWRTEGEGRAIALVRQVDRLKDHLDVRWVVGPASERQAVDAEGARLSTTVPVTAAGRQVGAVRLTESLGERRRYIATTVARTALVVLVLVASAATLALGLGYVLVGRPVRLLVSKARRVGSGDFDGVLGLDLRDELGELGKEMDLMAAGLARATRRAAEETGARIQALEQLRHADRLRVVGQLAAGVAHELGSPLCVVAGRAQLIAKGEIEGDDARASAVTINAQAERMAAIVRQLLNFARRQHADRQPCDLREMMTIAARMLQTEARRHNVELRLADSLDPVTVRADAGQIQQVVVNLVVNAIQAMPVGGVVDLGVERRRARHPDRPREGELEWAIIRVADQGVGMDVETQERAFEPFFTTKDVGQGTGLGLSVSHGIVEEHGGWIAVESMPGTGSRFSVYLPLGAPEGRGATHEPGASAREEDDDANEHAGLEPRGTGAADPRSAGDPGRGRRRAA